MDKIKATLRGGDFYNRDLFVEETQLFVIHVYCKEELDYQGVWTRIGPWGKIETLVKDFSRESKNRKGGYRKCFLYDDAMKDAGYLGVIMEVKKTASSKEYFLHINVSPAFCI